MNYLVVGSGFFGATMAQHLAEAGKKVTIVEKRSHIAGNAYSEFDKETGIEVHKYGSHLFHTSNKDVWDYVNRFTSFTEYRHTVWSNHNNKLYPMPINLATISLFYNKFLSPEEAKSVIKNNSMHNDNPKNLEEKAISLIGKDLYDAFIKDYTKKQWQVDPKELPPEVISRLPVRYNLNHRYFSDTYEGLPVEGYTKWVSNMIDHKNIDILLDTDFFSIKDSLDSDTKIIYTGPIDRYFDYCEGELGWRTLDFKWETHDISDYQGSSVVNYPDLDYDFTRIHEFKHLHPERKYSDQKTIIAKEYSRLSKRNEEPYYPINSTKDRETLLKYRSLIKKEKNTLFGGRLGSYQYLDMHMAIKSAMSKFKEINE